MNKDKTISYPYLLRRALKLSIEAAIVLVILFFLPGIIRFIQVLYGF